MKAPSQGAVPEAQILLTRVEDKSQYPATTDPDGAFHFVNLKPGHYDLAISASGFAEFIISSAQLDPRQTLRFDVALKLATSAQSIEVGGEAGPYQYGECDYWRYKGLCAGHKSARELWRRDECQERMPIDSPPPPASWRPDNSRSPLAYRLTLFSASKVPRIVEASGVGILSPIDST